MRTFAFCLFIAISCPIIQGRRGRGLDRCRPFIEGCSMRQGRLAGKEFPHYIVENFVEGDLNCSSYLPSDSQDLDVADLHDAVSQACAESGPESVVRLCMLSRRDTKSLMRFQDLSEDEMDDLDFSNVALSNLGFRGKCFICPQADPNNNNVQTLK